MRSFWSRSPCIASASKPWRFSDFATTSTSILRLQKMMPLVRLSPSARIRRRSTSRFSAAAVSLRRGVCLTTHCSMVSEVVAWRATSTRTGLCRNSGDPGDLRRHGGGEEQRLPGEGHELEDALDVGDEAHVEHAVGLVDDHDLHAGQHQLAALEVVEQAAGRGDQHVDAAVDELVLVLEADAADQQRHRELHVGGVFLELLGHLGGELARRREHQAPRHAGPGAALGEVGDHRQHEGAGLAGAGLGDAEHVAAFERVRDGLDLDRGGGDVAGFGYGLQDPRVQREFGKGCHVALRWFEWRRMAAALLHAAWTPGLGSRALGSYSDDAAKGQSSVRIEWAGRGKRTRHARIPHALL